MSGIVYHTQAEVAELRIQAASVPELEALVREALKLLQAIRPTHSTSLLVAALRREAEEYDRRVSIESWGSHRPSNAGKAAEILGTLCDQESAMYDLIERARNAVRLKVSE